MQDSIGWINVPGATDNQVVAAPFSLYAALLAHGEAKTAKYGPYLSDMKR